MALPNGFTEEVGFIIVPIYGRVGTNATTLGLIGAQFAQFIEDAIKADEHLDDPGITGDSVLNPMLGSAYKRGKSEYRLYPSGGSYADRKTT